MPVRDALFVDTRQIIHRIDVPPALVGHQAIDSPFDIQGWLWDDRFWTEPQQENTQAIIPTLYDPSSLGLTPDFFQSGIGDGNDLLITDIINRRINDKDTWLTELYHGEYFRGKERRYLYSDDSIVQYIDSADDVDNRNVVQLNYKLKETVPVSIETYKRSIVTGDYYVYSSVRSRLEFTGRFVDGEELSTLVDAKIVWDNVDTDLYEAVIINDLEPQKIIFNKNYIEEIGKELPTFGERIILEKMGNTNDGIEGLLLRTKHFPIIRDDTLHVYLVNESSNEQSGPFNIVSIASATRTVVVDSGHFIEDNVEAGDMLEISGGNVNDGTYTVASVIDNNIVVVVEVVSDSGANGEAGQFVYEEWTQVNNFSNSGPSDKHFVVDRDLGEITFGNNENGVIPSLFSSVYITYKFTYKVEYEAENTRDVILAREVNLNPAISSTTTGFLFLTEEQVNVGFLELVSNKRLVPGFDALFGPVTVGNDFALLTATLRDTLYQPMPDIPVTFSILNNPAVGTINGTDTVAEVNTNGKGQAIAFFNPPSNIDTFGYYSVTLENSNQTLVLDDTSARITDASTVYVFQIRKDDSLLGKVNANTSIGEVPFRVQDNPLFMNGRKVIIYEYDAGYIHPLTEETGAYGPMQPSSVDGGFMLNFDTPLAEPDPSEVDDTNPIAGYWVISTRVVNLQASVFSLFLGKTIISNELKLQVSLPEHMLGVYVTPDGNKIPFGFRLKDNSIVAASALGGATFLSLNPPTAPDNLSLARSGDYDITISWDNTWIFDSSPVTGFTIYRSTNDGVWEFVGVANGSAISLEDIDLPLGDVNYKYQVRTDVQGASSAWEVSSNFFLTEPSSYATGWIEVIDNAVLSGTEITVGNKTFVQDIDWFTGADEAETMENITEAIQTYTNNEVTAVIGAVCSVDLQAIKPGENGNSIGLAVTGFGSTASHNYGYPTSGVVESNVTEQWLFDEASGSSYGEVINFRLDASGTKTYSQDACGRWRNTAPGIYCNSGDMRRSDTWGQTLVPLHPGTQEFQIEVVCKKPPTSATYQYIWYLDGAWNGSYGSSLRCYWYNDMLGISQHESYGSDVTRWVPINAAWNDGKVHHIKVTGKWRQQMQVYVDTVLEVTTNWTYWPGLNDPWAWSEGIYPSSIRFGSTGYYIYEARMTIGNRTNNSLNNDTFGPGVVLSGSTLSGGAI